MEERTDIVEEPKTDLEKEVEGLLAEAQDFIDGKEPQAEPEPTSEPEPDPAPDVQAAAEPTLKPEPEVEPTPDPVKAELTTVKKRWSDAVSWGTKLNQDNLKLHSDVESLTAQLESLKKKLEAPPAETPESLKKIQEEYPELAENLFPAINEMVANKTKTVAEELAEIKRMQADNAVLANKQELYKAHADADMVTADDSVFWRWLDTDTSIPASLKHNGTDSKNVRDNIAIISLFKKEFQQMNAPAPTSDVAPKTNLKKQAADANAEPRVAPKNPNIMGITQAPTLTTADLAKMSLDDFSKLTDAQLKQVSQSELASAAMI